MSDIQEVHENLENPEVPVNAFNIPKGEFLNIIKSISLKDKEIPISFGSYGMGKSTLNSEDNIVILLNGSKVEFVDGVAKIRGAGKSIDELIRIIRFLYDGEIQIRRFVGFSDFKGELYSLEALKDFLSYMGFSEWEARGHIWAFKRILGDENCGFYEIVKEDNVFEIHRHGFDFIVRQYKAL